MQKLLCGVAQRLLLVSLSIIFFTACQREVEDTGGNNNGGGNTTAIDDNITVVASLRGVVIDENGLPVIGATVKSGTNTTTTDRYGVFRFSGINLSKENGRVQVERNGYFTAYRTFPATAGRTHHVRIRLLPKTNTGNFTASSGGTITLTSGGKLVMPANAVTDASGNPYSGQVNVAMTWIDPTAANLPEIIMGDLRGVTTTGQERGLETFGMLGVEMTTPGGQALKVASGKTAELSFPIPASLSGNAPATIDLWHFDEATARWKQEGTATKTGSMYVANVSHFSFWNCDAPFPLVNLCMSFVNAANNQPLNNVQVRITRANGSYGAGWTDSAGNLCGKVPKDEPLTLQILGQCNNVVYTQPIGPFSSNSTLPTISATIPAANTITFTGTVTNCAGSNVTNGAVVIYTSGVHSYTVPVTNGTFSLTILNCNTSGINYSALAVDYSSLQQSVSTGGTATSGNVSLGTLQACGTSANQFIELLIDGTPYNFISPPDYMQYNDSTNIGGSYSHRTQVFASRQNAGTQGFCSIMFDNNLVAANNLPLTLLSLSVGSGMSTSLFVTPPTPLINITEYGAPVSGFVGGNFNVNMNFSGTTKNVVCTFRVRRN